MNSQLNFNKYQLMLRRLVNTFKFSKSKDLYTVFNIPASSTQQQIKKQYLKLAKQYHPDYNPSTAEKFKQINAAYQILGDQAKRKQYDSNMMFNRKSSSSTTSNSNYYHDPFQYTGVYNSHRTRGRRATYQQHAQREADMYRDYFRQQTINQENFWKEFHDQQQKNAERSTSGTQSPVSRLWVMFVFGMGFTLFMTLFTAKLEKANGNYVKVIDPITSKVTFMPRVQFQRNRAYYQVANELGKRNR